MSRSEKISKRGKGVKRLKLSRSEKISKKYRAKYGWDTTPIGIKIPVVPVTITKKTPVVLFVARVDYANVGFLFAESLREVGVKAYSFQRKINAARPHQSKLYRAPKELTSVAKRADAVVWMQTEYSHIETSLVGKRLAVFHGGTLYRSRSKIANKVFNPIVHVTLIQTAEMLDRGAKNEQWILPPAYVGNIQPKFSVGKKLVIGHYPSAPGVPMNLVLKGSSLINKLMKRYSSRVEFRFSAERVSWEDNLKRMNDCDIYIESLNQLSTSTNKLDWSLQALEAAALGKIVVTNFSYGKKRYKKEYGNCALQVTNTEKQFIYVMDSLLSTSRDKLIELKHDSRKWAVELHGLKATGLRLRKALEI